MPWKIPLSNVHHMCTCHNMRRLNNNPILNWVYRCSPAMTLLQFHTQEIKWPKHSHVCHLKQVHSLEVIGPVLPSCMYELCRLLQDTQDGQFAASFSVHQLSVAFNIPSVAHQDPWDPTHDSGLSTEQMEYFKESTVPSNLCMKELHCQNSVFSWKGPEQS